MTEFSYDRYKEPVDQLLHYAVGGALTAMFMTVLSWFPAWMLMLGMAAMRELWQHRKTVSERGLGWGSVFDLTFFALGGLQLATAEVGIC